MSSNFAFRIFFALCISFLFALDIHKRHHAHPNREELEDNQLMYAPYLSGIFLPLCLSLTLVLLIATNGLKQASEDMLSMWFGDFMQIGIYYMVLLPILPFMRKHISARACAVLWIIPNYLYITQRDLMELSMPRFIIHAPETLVRIAFYIWITGFIGIFAWKIFSHLKFRHEILKDSAPVTNSFILDIWNQEIESANIKKPKFRLVFSPHASTPVSIGLFKRSIRVILPERDYAADELSLIFRHELVHISREDACTKFFLTFCTAMLWFHPIMWITMRKCSDDLELSCDETVLLECDDATRRQYAELILNTAGVERGFTTCLSASAKSLRYRLQNIVKPKKKHSGALVVGLLFFLLILTTGHISLAYSSHTGAELIYQQRESNLYQLNHIAVSDDPYHTIQKCTNEEALHQYLWNLTMEELTGDYTYSDSERQLTLIFDTPDGVFSTILYDKAIKIVLFNRSSAGGAYYYLPDGTDWEYIDSLIMSYPALNIQVHISGNSYSRGIGASLWDLNLIQNGKTTQLYKITHPEETPSGMIGYEADEAILDFSHSLVSDFAVKVESWNRESSYTIFGSSFHEEMILPLADYPAHYTIYAKFHGPDESIYEAEYRFDFGDLDNTTQLEY